MTTQERQEYAAQLKREMNCCQAVVRAFADTLDMPEDKLMQLAAGFGSGMGTMEGTCGALVGAIMVAGLRTGGNGTMALSRKMLPRFKELCGGATICRDLKGVETGKVLCSCENCVRNAVLAAEEAIEPKS
jgi:C_GCAxxG_C_C family probable redox protein